MSETAETRRGSRPRGAAAKMALALVLAAAVLAFAEVASRWLVPDASVHLGFARDRKMEPYTMFGAGRSETGLNELGYRGPAPTLPKPPGEIRVVMLGGSTVFLGKPALPELLEKELQSAGLHRVRVYNFGVVASVSGMELARLVHQVLDLDPDLVIFYDGANDITAPVLYDPRPGYPPNFYVMESNPFLGADFSVAAWLASRSHLARILFPRWIEESLFPLARLRAESGWGSERWRERIAEIYTGNLEKAASLLRGRDVGFAAIFQPMLYFKKRLADSEVTGADLVLGMVSHAAPKAWRDGQPQTLSEHSLDVRQRIRAKAAALPPATRRAFIDLSDFFAADDAVFLDFVHVRPEAKPRLAAAIARALLARPALAERLRSPEAVGRGGP